MVRELWPSQVRQIKTSKINVKNVFGRLYMYFYGLSTLGIKFECLGSSLATKISYLRNSQTLSRTTLGDSLQLCFIDYCDEEAHVGFAYCNSKLCNYAFTVIIKSPYSILTNCYYFIVSIMCLWF